MSVPRKSTISCRGGCIGRCILLPYRGDKAKLCKNLRCRQECTSCLSRRSYLQKSFQRLVVLSLASCLRFLLALNTRLLVMLSLTDFLLDTSLCAASLETTQCAVQSLILFYDYARHFFYPPFSPFRITSRRSRMFQTVWVFVLPLRNPYRIPPRHRRYFNKIFSICKVKFKISRPLRSRGVEASLISKAVPRGRSSQG